MRINTIFLDTVLLEAHLTTRPLCLQQPHIVIQAFIFKLLQEMHNFNFHKSPGCKSCIYRTYFFLKVVAYTCISNTYSTTHVIITFTALQLCMWLTINVMQIYLTDMIN